jgi:hypothetical protein
MVEDSMEEASGFELLLLLRITGNVLQHAEEQDLDAHDYQSNRRGAMGRDFSVFRTCAQHEVWRRNPILSAGRAADASGEEAARH